MIQTPANYLPVQQAAVTQQIQQNQAPAIGAPKYNAVLIDIKNPTVDTASKDPVYGMPYSPIYNYPQAQQAN